MTAPGWASSLWAMSCTSSARCFAIGGTYLYAPGRTNPPAGIGRTLLATWDGRGWSVMAAPELENASGGNLNDISCSDPESCVAVGQAGPNGEVVIERFDGARWTVEQHPAFGSRWADKRLGGVSCVSRTSCVAVGSATSADGGPFRTRALILSFDGTRWSSAPDPAPAGSNDYLGAVSCSAEHCAAVGTFHTSASIPRPLVVAGSILRRSVSVSWTAAENAWLRQISAYLHRSPAATQKAAVYSVAYLLGLAPRAATHANLPTAGSAATYTTVWNPPELTVLDTVRARLRYELVRRDPSFGVRVLVSLGLGRALNSTAYASSTTSVTRPDRMQRSCGAWPATLSNVYSPSAMAGNTPA